MNSSPVVPEANSFSSQSGLQFVSLGKGNFSLNKIIEVSEWVTRKDGGELILEYKGEEHNNGDVYVKITLKVFPETVREDTKITLSLDDQVLLANVDIVFGPNGTTFNQPALLNIEAKGLDVSGFDPSKIDLYYDIPDIDEWEKMETKEVIVKPEEGYVKTIDGKIHHFSRYAVAWSN